MRNFRRKYQSLVRKYCIHVKRDEDFVNYCDKGNMMFDSCNEHDCPDFEGMRIKRMSNRQCKQMVHDIQKLAKVMRR